MEIPKDKSVGAALVLTFLFGPVGLFYASVAGGLVMLIVGIPLALVTLGLAIPVVWAGSMIWGAVAASNKHTRHQAGLAGRLPGQGPLDPGE